MSTRSGFGIGIIACFVLAGCATVTLPDNAKVVPGANGGNYLDRVDFSYNADAQDFASLKLCIAEGISNSDVMLKDSAGSFVGAYSRRLYTASNTQSVAGREVFKYVDDQRKTLVASGTTMYDTGVLVKDILKFDIKSAVTKTKVQIEFFNITRAQQNTGNSANDGFGAVGVWPGARTQDAYDSLKGVADKLRNCMA